eukprot:TRINITY_DN3123_c0_g2_i3.p1 TRINITY_DN3123_c0_g2~~TRINITY_DN3123_c0_g2_i3.p1  ORF type:complete len:135 (-),score=28.45 TRINITY_DN3123_c0_g2_i3:310-714(-)
MSCLNPNAPVFVPQKQACLENETQEVVEQEEKSLSESGCGQGSTTVGEVWLEAIPEDEQEEYVTETNMSQAELDEIEAVENWVDTMAWLEELEREHCIELALRLAPKQKVLQIEDKLGLWKFSKTPMKRRGRQN